MAQYRMSVSMIGRSSGRSATAAAAYRAGIAIVDQETGLVHDYTAKRGVLHSEIITPANTPQWMQDRSQLWNAVHKVETRKNSQLAREMLLNLPHELNQEQQVNLVKRFVEEQCVSRGMIADISVHAPSSAPGADERNFHAHVMLTTREFVGGNWAKNKNRNWHKTEMIEEWREVWAQHQNRELERLGFEARVDHRSYEDQGILKEPQKHMGPIATEIERNGRKSHIGNENREIQARNGLLNDISTSGNLIDAKIVFEKRKFEAWAEAKRGQLRLDQQARKRMFDETLHKQMEEFEKSLDAEIGQTKQGVSRAHEQVSDRLQVRGWRKFIRDITFTTRRDKKQLESLEYERARLLEEENRRRQAQEAQQQGRRDIRATEEMKKSQLLEKSLQKAEHRREQEGWSMRAGKGVKDAQEVAIREKQQPQEQEKPPAPLQKDKLQKMDFEKLRDQRITMRREREEKVRDNRGHDKRVPEPQQFSKKQDIQPEKRPNYQPNIEQAKQKVAQRETKQNEQNTRQLSNDGHDHEV